MRLDQKLIDVAYMSRDFLSVVRGTGYFHQPDLLGRYFVDGRSYYVDFRCKTNWEGEFDGGVPLLFVPSLKRRLAFPGMILQFGLGCLDRHFEDDLNWESAIESVAKWLSTNCSSDGSFDNLSRELNSDPAVAYHSNNSAMTQGLAISFLTRAIKHNLVVDPAQYEAMLSRIHDNMMLTVADGGTVLQQGSEILFCEYCRTDNQVVLNGWIFAIFGLVDFARHWPTASADGLDNTITTLAKHVDQFIIPGTNWSRYDNLGRIASPVYQITHITQMDALYRLTGNRAFQLALARLLDGNNLRNKTKFTLRKIFEKLRDQTRYSSAS